MADAILTDTAPLSGRRRTGDGYMLARCRVARAENVQVYTGAEVGRPEMAVARIYRPEAAVFDTATMAAWAHKPITVSHPQLGTVNAENWRDEAVGLSGGEIGRDGEFLTVPMMLADAATIEAVEGGTAEISCGYRVALDWQAGTTPAGEAFDAKVTRVVPNHFAIVTKGRAGSECRFGDAGTAQQTVATPPTSQESRPMADDMRAVILDGITVTTNPAGAEAIARLQRQINDAAASATAKAAEAQTLVDSLNGQVAAMKAAATQAAEAHAGEVAGLKAAHQTALDAAAGEITALKAQTTDEALNARVAARGALVQQARRVLGDGFDPAGKTDADVRRAVVTKALGANLSDADAASEAFCDAAFRTVMAMAPAAAARPDPLRLAIAGGAGTVAQDAARQEPTAYERNLHRLQTAWQNPGAKEAV